MLDLFDTPYTDMFKTTKFKRHPRPTKFCHADCPTCGKKDVNVYLSKQQEQYMCKECIDNQVERSNS